MAVFGYTRVSTDRQASDGDSLEVQRRQIEGYVHMHGLTLDALYVERGVSGSMPVAERPEGAKLWATMNAGDIVIAHKLDRLFRSALDALQTVEVMRKRTISLVLIDLGGDISGNGLSKLFLTIAAAFAEAERDRIRERVSLSKLDQRSRGRYLGGKVPFGYSVTSNGDLTVDPEKQDSIARAKQMRSEGRSLRAIQTALFEDGVKLSLDALHRILKTASTG
jgi:putative DNA-invertase from lambdoid prophage Rac